MQQGECVGSTEMFQSPDSFVSIVGSVDGEESIHAEGPLSSPHRFQRMRCVDSDMRSVAISVSPADHEALMTFCGAKDDIQSDSETEQNRCQHQPTCPSQRASPIVGVRC